MLRIVLALAGDDADWSGLLFLAFVVAWGGAFGILGMIFHAAAGRRDKPSFLHYAAILFLPLLWLQLKLGVLVYTPLLLGAWGWHAAFNPPQALQDWLPTALYWTGPVAETVVLLLTLYSTPLAILLRERGARGAPIRDGVRMFGERRRESLQLLVLVAPTAILGAVAHFLQGPDAKDPVPSLLQGLTLMVTSYLTLVALFGACRVVALAAGPPPATDRDVDFAASAPGPPA